jgi:catechol 2,3-dioxygenase-like lactoylglutathione lyase family enzyme
MTAWLKNVDVITLFVEDLEGSKLFYQEILGLPLRFENENSAYSTSETRVSI